MKHKPTSIFLFLIFLVLGCKKHVTSDCLQAKVIRVTCASMVLQVLDRNSIGEDGWKDIFNSNTLYNNVFTVSNACHIPAEYKTGDVLYITINKAAASDCVHCALYDASPKVSYEVKTIGNLPCNDLK